MKYFQRAFLGAALLVALSSFAYAQGDGGGQQLSSFQLMNNRVLVVTPDGRVIIRPIEGSAMLGEIMRDARPMSAGTVLLMRDDKLYTAQDRPMADGTMLSGAITRMPAR